MQKTEIIDAILNYKREAPAITNKQLAFKLGLHRNTITKYVKYIRDNIIKTPEEIVNKIDHKLENELEELSHKNLIAYRRALKPAPQHIEAKGDFTQTQRVLHLHLWKPETVDPITSRQ